MPVLTLDARQPALDHHRPGEFPLFGTAMGIGALIEAGTMIGLCEVPARIEAIKVHAPYILDHSGPHRLTVEVAASGDGAIHSWSSAGDARMVHFEGRITHPPDSGPWHPPTVADLAGSHSVNQAQIYRTFFHGPAFQVVCSAKYHHPALLAQGAQSDWTRQIPPVTRIIEFGLQSAGLLELALTGRMMIPAEIDSIDLFDSGHGRHDCPIFARACQPDETSSTNRSDIVIWSEPDILMARISGYQTTELPFPVGSQRITDLRQSLLATADKAGR